MAAKAAICHTCGHIISGNPYNYKGHSYCYECFQELQRRAHDDDQARQKLSETLRQMFSISEVPELVLNAVDREVHKGKTIPGLNSTLVYWYKLMGNEPKDVNEVIYVWADRYNEARKYAEKVRNLRERNSGIDLTPRQVTYVIDPDARHSATRPPKFNIEDL